MTEEKRRFAVIENTDLEEKERRKNAERDDKYRKARLNSYQTNPLKEQFARFANEESGQRFSVEDLLKW